MIYEPVLVGSVEDALLATIMNGKIEALQPLSVTLGVPGDFMHPKCIEALKRVAAAAKKAGKAWGILSRDAEHARACRDLGCQLFSIIGDIDCIRVGLETIEARFADLMD